MNSTFSSLATKIALGTTSMVVASAFLLLPQSAKAAVIVLDFEGLRNLEPVNSYYNGGIGGLGSGPGPNYGITFSGNSLAIIDSDAGGTGNFGGEPSPSTILFFLEGAAAIMNVAAGFDTGFSFYYSAIGNPGFIRVFSELNGTGTLLAELTLPVTPSDGGDPTGAFSPFVPVGVSFTGVARSVDFGGVVNQIAFDNITLGSATPGNGNGVPIPTPALLPGLVSMGVAALRKRNQEDGDSAEA